MSAQSYPPGTVLMRPTLDALARNWWLILLRGICAVVFGILTFIWPGLTLLTLVLFYGAFSLLDGAFSIAAAVKGGAPMPRWWLALVGLLGIGVGIITLAWPQITGIVLLMFIAGWAIASGLLQIIGAIALRKEIEGEWWLVASGILSVVFGVLLIMYPGAGALSLAIVIGAFAVAYGILLIGFSLRLKKHADVRI
ncbi:MAG: HdeD family acid-resistance protein [Hyphomicrobium sp.]|nr:HdeD family acid-resistance protein [Hyphomicrobium sp.]